MPVDAPVALTPPPLPNRTPRIIAGFWRRAFGCIIDGAILMAAGKTLGYFYFEPLVSMGSWALLLGTGIAALYYIPLTSRFGGGRTFGKMIVGTRVVGRDGDPVDLTRSAIRFAVYFGVVFFGKLPSLPPWLGATFHLVGFCAFWTTLFLLLFNRSTRQTLHDLAAGTFVVEDVWSEGPVTQRTPRRSLLIASSIGILLTLPLVIVHAVIDPLAQRNAVVRARTAASNALTVQPEVATVHWSRDRDDAHHHVHNRTRDDQEEVGSEKRLYLKVTLRGRPASFDRETDKIAAILFREYPAAPEQDEITVCVAYGYDLAIAQSEIREETAHSPKEWQDRLSGISGQK